MKDIHGVLTDCPPPGLLLGYARFMGQGKEPVIHRVENSGYLVGWMVSISGQTEALPGRMYGFLFSEHAPVFDLDTLYKDLRREFGGTWRVHLPPMSLGPKYEATYKGHLGRYENHSTFVLRGETEEQYWACLKRVGRQGVEKARKAGVVVKSGFGGAQMMQFLSLNVHKSARVKSPAMNREELSRLRAEFGDGLQLHVGFLDGRPIAAVMSVMVDSYGLLIDNSSHEEAWDSNPNNLVVWEAVAELARRGAKLVGMGFSPPEHEGSARFKIHMGGEQAFCYTVGAR